MEPNIPTNLLGGLSPALFMLHHWQKKPLLVRQAISNMQPVLNRNALFALVEQTSVESRLVVQQAGQRWRLQHGPFTRKKMPNINTPGWTLLVQGANLHIAGADEILQKFRFLPDARLDDLMISFATTGGGVGPHFDSYDVFLLQASGRRQWRIGAQKNLELVDGAPMKILRNFQPEQTFDLEAGDMLYLPPGYAHDGIALPSEAENGCMTYSIGFQAPSQNQLAIDLLHKLADFQEDQEEMKEGKSDSVQKSSGQLLYQDPAQPATENPAQIPQTMVDFAQQAIDRVLGDSKSLALALGELWTEPKSAVDFVCPANRWQLKASSNVNACVFLDARTRMLYDQHHVFINGESWLAKGADAVLLKRLANQRCLGNESLHSASKKALALLQSWHKQGWLHFQPDDQYQKEG